MVYLGKLIIYLLAVYGMLALLFNVFSLIRTKIMAKGSKLKLVLIVKNAGGCIEYVVRCLVRKVLADSSLSIGSMAVFDMGSNDDTADILTRLTGDFSSVEVLEDKDKIFSGFQ